MRCISAGVRVRDLVQILDQDGAGTTRRAVIRASRRPHRPGVQPRGHADQDGDDAAEVMSRDYDVVPSAGSAAGNAQQEKRWPEGGVEKAVQRRLQHGRKDRIDDLQQGRVQRLSLDRRWVCCAVEVMDASFASRRTEEPPPLARGILTARL